MSSERFYVLSKEKVGSDFEADALDWGEPNTGPAPECEQCGKTTGMLVWEPPFEIELECWGRGFGDIIFPADGYELLVSERFKTAYDANGLIGLSGFHPVRVCRAVRRGKIKEDPPRYFVGRVAFGRAAIDQRASEFVWRAPPTCPECREGNDLMRYKRLVVEPGTWSGEDIFIPRGVFAYMVTDRFKRVCEENGIRNAVFTPAEKSWHDTYPWENLDRARELLKHPLDETVLEKQKANGEVWRYCPETNELAIQYPDGRVKMFRPVTEQDYWDQH